MNGLVAQGDLLFIPVERVPAGFVENTKLESDRHVLAHGEATGHSHSILANKAKFFVADKPSGGATAGYIVAERGARVEHLKNLSGPADHPPLGIEGIYEVRRQQEWSDDKEPRRVAD